VRPDPGEGIFETVLVVGAQPVDLDAHLARFARSLALLYGVALPDGFDALVRFECARQGAPTARMRIDYEPRRSSDPFTVGVAPTRESFVQARDPQPLEGRLLEVPGGLGPHKWRDRRLVEAAADPRVAIVCDGEEVLEAGHANVLVVEGERLATPPEDGRLLPGITRRRVLELASQLGLDAVEEPLPLERLVAADDVLLTSAIRGVHRLGRCERLRAWRRPSEAARALAEALGAEAVGASR
jgi:para-aminobenzoate synthetase / 4-amino-4-deoxychorismate lyase